MLDRFANVTELVFAHLRESVCSGGKRGALVADTLLFQTSDSSPILSRSNALAIGVQDTVVCAPGLIPGREDKGDNFN